MCNFHSFTSKALHFKNLNHVKSLADLKRVHTIVRQPTNNQNRENRLLKLKF